MSVNQYCCVNFLIFVHYYKIFKEKVLLKNQTLFPSGLPPASLDVDGVTILIF